MVTNRPSDPLHHRQHSPLWCKSSCNTNFTTTLIFSQIEPHALSTCCKPPSTSALTQLNRIVSDAGVLPSPSPFPLPLLSTSRHPTASRRPQAASRRRSTRPRPAMLQLNADAAVCTADVSSPTAYIQVSLVFPLHATSNMLVCAPTRLMRGPSKKPRLWKTTSPT